MTVRLEQKPFNPSTKVTEPVNKARAALQPQIIALEKTNAAAQSTIITNNASQKSVSAAGKFPWAGQLRDHKDTPLHWAVRNRDFQTALKVRSQIRLSRLAAFCQRYAETVKDPKTAAILKQSDCFAKLIPAIEKLHILSDQTLDSKALQRHFKDPDILKVLQDPEFHKIFNDPNVATILNGLDVLFDLDSRGVSPLDEAILRQNDEMKNLLLFPHLVMNQELGKIFSDHIKELKSRIAAICQVDPITLSGVCRAAYLGDVDQLRKETDFHTKDMKGLTPLHYAILGRKTESIEYLLDRSDLYALTPQGHSYLDYAILTGNRDLMILLEKRNLPLRLSEPQERFNYSFASGMLHRQLIARAFALDPIAKGGKDQDFLGFNTNAVWAGAFLFNCAFPNNVELGWMSKGIEFTSKICNTLLGIEQVYNLPPGRFRPVALSIMALGFMCGVQSQLEKDLYNPLNVVGVASKVFSILRFLGAVKPVIERLPDYYHAYSSRPLPVMKAIAWDAFNIGTQALMTDYSILYSAKSRFFG